MSLGNEEIIRKLYAAGEGSGMDTEKFVSFFSKEGYMYDVPSGTKFRGKAIGDSIAALAKAFPDVHRELLSVYVAEKSSSSSLEFGERMKVSWPLVLKL